MTGKSEENTMMDKLIIDLLTKFKDEGIPITVGAVGCEAVSRVLLSIQSEHPGMHQNAVYDAAVAHIKMIINGR